MRAFPREFCQVIRRRGWEKRKVNSKSRVRKKENKEVNNDKDGGDGEVEGAEWKDNTLPLTVVAAAIDRFNQSGKTRIHNHKSRGNPIFP